MILTNEQLVFSEAKNFYLYMARCNVEEDCDAGIRMICVSGKCICKPGDLFFEWPKYGCFSKAHMFGPCEVSGQCVAMNPNTYCNPDSGRCTCSPNYFYNGRECSIRYDGNNMKAQEVYKAAVVAAACFIVAVVGIFVACIVRRSFCRRDQHLHQSDPTPGQDVFSISDEIAALRAVDKPPSYEEVLQIERTFYGIPPPEYSASRSTFRPATNYASRTLPPSQPHSSSLKAQYQESAPAYSRDPPPAHDSNFLADVEVLPTPDLAQSPPELGGHRDPEASVSYPDAGTSYLETCPQYSDVGTSALHPDVGSSYLETSPQCPDVGASYLERSQHPGVGASYLEASALHPDVETSYPNTSVLHSDVGASYLETSPDVGTLDQTSVHVEQSLAQETRCLPHYISSTPPPPRLHRLRTASSSSLPGSPNLSSGFRVLNLPNPFSKDLLKNRVQSSEPNSPSRSELPVSSISCTLDSELAYDNLGFVSDLHV